MFVVIAKYVCVNEVNEMTGEYSANTNSFAAENYFAIRTPNHEIFNTNGIPHVICIILFLYFVVPFRFPCSVLHAPCNQPKHPVCDPLLHKCTPAGINRRLMNLFVALRVEREFDFSLRTANASRAFHSIHIHCAVQRIFR